MSEETRAPRYFPSARDRTLAALIWGPFIGLIALGWIDGGYWPVAIVAALYLLLAWIWFGTGYTITATELIIQSGPLRWRIKLDDIEHVKATRNWYSSAALSLDRLEIKYARLGAVYVSPKDREAFLALMRERCPRARFIDVDAAQDAPS